jgi:predicted permease
MRTLWQDVRFALRTLRANPGFAAIAILTLALGVGANAAIFSMINSILLRPLPVKDPGQITVLTFQRGHSQAAQSISYPEFQDIQQQPDGPFSSLVAWEIGSVGLRINGSNHALLASYVPAGFFDALGIKAEAGRLLLPSEGKTPGADPVVVLGYNFWSSRLGADPNVVGSKVLVNGHPFTVVGVAPKGFHGLSPLIDMQAYLPYAMEVSAGGPDDLLTNVKNDNLHPLGRLKPGVSLNEARAALAVESSRLAAKFPELDKQLSIAIYPELLSRPDPGSASGVILAGQMFLALAILVLLLACANVANLLLVRATIRHREVAIRIALGSSKSRILRLLLTESVILALAGGIGGVLLGAWSARAIGSIDLHTSLPLAIDFSFDWRVFSYSFLAALLTGILVGIVPAFRASRTSLMETLRESGRAVAMGRHRLRGALVTAQVAGSLMLLVIATLFIRSMRNAQRVDLGFKPEGLVNMTMDPSGIGYSAQQSQQFFDDLLQRVRAVPGVQSASLAFAVPLGYYNSVATPIVAGYQPPKSEGEPQVVDNYLSPGYFANLGIPMVRGRDFNDGDRQDAAHVAIINRAFADKFWPGQDAMGREFRLKDDKKQHQVQIVGIVENSRYDDLSGDIKPFLYLPFTQEDDSSLTIFTLQVRVAGGDAESIVPAVEKVIAGMAPTLPVFNVQTMMDGLDTINGFLIYRLGAVLASVMGLLGLVLAIVGVYGVVSYATSQRTHEIGIRMALGAQSREILGLVLRQGLLIVSIGLAVGLLLATVAGRVVGQFLVGVGGTDPLSFALVSVVLAAVALFACWIPARRAMRVDPAIALRHE